jgi:PAS domain S-box-containing protein
LPSNATLHALRTFANQAGTAIVSARQRAALERRTAELEALHTTTLSLLESVDATDVLETIVARAAELVGTTDGYLYRVDPSRERLVLEIALGTFADYRGTELGFGEGLSGRVWAQRQAMAVDDYAQWAGGAPTYVGAGFRAIAGVPLVVGGDVVGVIGVGHAADGVSFGASELTLLTRFAHLASLVLERAQLLRRLQDERDYSERLIDSANALVVGVGPDGAVEVFNEEASRITGYGAEEVLGRSFVRLLPAGLYPDAGDRFVRSLLDGTLPEQYETPILTRDGEERLIDFRLRVVFVDGQPHGLIAFGTDVTEVRRLEEELRQSQKMEAVGRLAGGIAHDFNNLLTAITGYAELALVKLDGTPDVREHVFEMKRAGERAADLTRQLLAFSRRQVLQPETLSVNGVVTDLERMLRRLLGAHVEFSTDLDPQLGSTKADPGQLEQVVMNLALNARDAMPGGGRLTVSTRNEEIDGNAYVVLEVSDDGHGMDDATLERAVEPFFTTKPPGEGTGLGLSTVYGIVKQSGGELVATSTPGLGTTMRVLLPRVTPEPDRREEPAPTPLPRVGATVLLAEDEDVVRRLLARILTDEGYEVIETANGAEALAAAQSAARIDYLVTDVVMPGVGGADLAATLRESRAGLRVLFVSGYSADAIGREREATPGVGFLQKPFTRAELVRALDALTANAVAA